MSADALERLATPAALRVLELFRAHLDGDAPHTPEPFHAAMREIQRRLDLGGSLVYPIVRLAVSGIEHGPELDRLPGVLGPDHVRRRLELVRVRP